MPLPKPYYDRDGITIYHGDCKDILPELPKVDIVLTDPPYLLNMGGGGGGVFGDRASRKNTKGFTDGGFDVSVLSQYSDWFCFCSKNNLCDVISAAGDKWNILQWCKPNPVPTCNNTYLSDVEYCIHTWSKGRLFGDMKDKSKYFVHPCGNKVTEHPNEKPVQLIYKLVTLGSQDNETILDPFMGSGTTLVAAKQLKRKAIGIELEEKYCEIAVNRLAQSVLPLGGE